MLAKWKTPLLQSDPIYSELDALLLAKEGVRVLLKAHWTSCYNCQMFALSIRYFFSESAIRKEGQARCRRAGGWCDFWTISFQFDLKYGKHLSTKSFLQEPTSDVTEFRLDFVSLRIILNTPSISHANWARSEQRYFLKWFSIISLSLHILVLEYSDWQ